ncbi:putative Tetratricopeptide TPR_2 repeat protein [Candidatus Promineifilum breve]|uniref:Tetratricopeptide TPR_2 repeat protein n=1 Tax=Candidatus Promineifilum breve TaxID=1806508 RepID=A0A160SZK3_9CHLR|nr:B-box zinc finger protein [Candidatus Promineifilum breve]CUS02846.2 putative Tetratricopeptide TPR_2 repeat protein [Candidatus Promineifilum breve]
MMITDPRLRTLLTQAERNASYGKNAAAESMYRQILSDAPDVAEAWAGLAAVVGDPAEKRAAYERALALAPDMPAAVAGLARLDGRPVPPEVEAALAPVEVVKAAAPPEAATSLERALGVPGEAKPEAAAYELVCYRHPDRPTSLRCYNCNRPICISCANKTPVGYICPECQRDAEDAFFNSRPIDYLVAALVSLPISLLAGYLMTRFAGGMFVFFLLIFFISGAVGGFIGRITKRAIGGRRGRYLPALVVAMMVLGVAIPVFLGFLTGMVGLFNLIGPAIYLFVGASAAYWQMR